METIIPFLNKLSENNNREWFQANKKEFDKAQKELQSFINTLIEKLKVSEPELSELTAKDCMFRIYRDTRFSKDKQPYKTNMGAVIAPGGRKSSKGCYYVHIDPNGCFLAGGRYMPEGEELKNIRQEIDYNLSEFESILNTDTFKKHFSGLDQNHRLKTTPKGYDAENPAIDHLKNKSFTVSVSFKADKITKNNFMDYCLDVFAAIRPLNAFINRSAE